MNVTENDIVPQQINHTCCDNCAKTCSCLCQCNLKQCACTLLCQNQVVFRSSAEVEIVRSNLEYVLQSQSLRKMVYLITEDPRELFHSRLLEYRQSLLNDEEQQQVLTHPDLTT